MGFVRGAITHRFSSQNKQIIFHLAGPEFDVSFEGAEMSDRGPVNWLVLFWAIDVLNKFASNQRLTPTPTNYQPQS